MMTTQTCTPVTQMTGMLAAIQNVNPGRYGLKVDELDAIARAHRFDLFAVAQDAFNLGFSRGQQRIKRLRAKTEQERRENALRELLDRFSALPDERKKAVLEAVAAAITNSEDWTGRAV